ncbi:MAG: hypothetical protein IKQ59_04950 [Prevotella sp.]|nr:hypothetical protein [Prevotella sp.]
MKTKYLFFAAIAGLTLASCADDVFVGDNSPTVVEETTVDDGAIRFGFEMPNNTRADIAGAAAADLLSYRFYVTGTKGTETGTYPTDSLVFDNYLVMYKVNSAGTTASNTANWEYVGLSPQITATVTTATNTGACEDSLKLSGSNVTTQTIKYWDYTHLQYDFLAFSTGKYKAVSAKNSSDAFVTPASLASDEIGVTAMKYGDELVSSTAYTFILPSVQALKNAYISDITEVARANFGNEVTLKFKNLGSKVRVALYETVPGYSVKAESVRFYTEDGTTDFTDDKGTPAALISEDARSFATSGQIDVSFPNIGTSNHGNGNYDKASATVVSPAGTNTWKTFGNLASGTYVAKEGSETSSTDALYLGRTLPTATFAGDPNASYYQTVFPVSSSYPLTLRVDYTLIATDGSGEEINVYGAKAVVPGTYTVWKPNYAYTYIFKITDNTNGWTSPDHVQDGLFPITFDAVVAEFTDAQGEQTTVTTVATPSITTYQQGHNSKTNGEFTVANEYSKTTGKNIYVQVMDNSLATPKPVGTGSSSKPLLNDDAPYTASLLFAVNSTGKTYSTQPAGWPKGYYTDATCNTEATGAFSTGTTYYKRCTEAEVMDALENRTTPLSAANVTGRNGITLTNNASISNTVTAIANGVDDNEIVVNPGEAAEITISGLTAGTYAYVYDYSESVTETATSKTVTNIYQPIATTIGDVIGDQVKYITKAVLDGQSLLTTGDEDVDPNYIYFSKTTNGQGAANTTYSFVSVDGKKKVPDGLLKVSTGALLPGNGTTTTVVAGTIVFDIYLHNNGSYAVKVIKVVD